MKPRTLLVLLLAVVLLAAAAYLAGGSGFMRGLGARIHGPG